MNILITGCSGYIGKNIINFFIKKKSYNLTLLSRSKINYDYQNVKVVYYKNFDQIDFDYILNDINIVIHLISKQHSNLKNNNINFKSYYEVNVNITNKLINEINKKQIAKFIFVSTVKVYGEYTLKYDNFSLDSKKVPITNYAKTKLEAENLIKKQLNTNITNYTIIRLPLVYGGEEKGNFHLLKKIIKTGIPLPFKNINNSKSLLHIKNLLHFIDKIITSEKSNNMSFIISDDLKISTSEIIKILMNSLNKKNYLFFFPYQYLTKLYSLVNKSNFFIKLYYSLNVDNNFAKKKMNVKFKYNFFDYINRKDY